MTKFCIFCGERPESKTREHIIPQWLLKLTGNPARSVNLGLDISNGHVKTRRYSFNSLHFPACNSCNNKYGELETLSQEVINKLLQKENLNQFELTILLDWLDKVRVGIWLGYQQLDKDIYDIIPNYYISHRLRSADRMLGLYRIKENFKGVSFGITESPLFRYNPVCFCLYINQICLFNLSTTFIFTHNLGFPYPEKVLYDGEFKTLTINKMNEGIHRIKKPIYRKPFMIPGFEVYQVIWTEEAKEKYSEFYDTDYVKENTLKEGLRCSKLFLNRNGEITIVDEDIDTNCNEYKLLELDKKITIQTSTTLNDLAFQFEFTDNTPTEVKKRFKISYDKAKKLNKQILEQRLKYLEDFI